MTDISENSEASSPQFESLQRFSKLPVVELMWNQTTGMYEKVKGSNSVVNWTLSSAEATVNKAMQHAAPVAKKFEQPIHKVDETLCKGLNTLEEKVPMVKEKPEQVLEAAKTYVNATMQPAMEKVEAMKRFGTACGNYAMISLDATVEMADQYVEYYLPEEKTESPESTVAVQTVNGQSVPQKVGRISVRVGKGVYRTIVTQMRSLGTKSEKSLTSLTHLSELLHMTSVAVDGSAIAARASQLWTQLRLDNDFGEDSDEDKGEKPSPGSVAMASLVARRLVKNVLNLCTQAAKSLPSPPGPLAATASSIPSQLSSRLEMAAEYAKGMYIQLKMYNFHEASDSIKINMKEQIGKIQTVLKDLNSYASQWLEANQPEENGAEKDTSQTEENGAAPTETTSTAVAEN